MNLHCDLLHGKDETNQMNSHYLISFYIDQVEFYNKSYEEYIQLMCENYHMILFRVAPYGNPNFSNSIIRNFNTIIQKSNYAKLDIVESIFLDSGQYVACIKTFWLRLLQRKWKTFYKKQQILLKQRRSIHFLKKRELYGR